MKKGNILRFPNSGSPEPPLPPRRPRLTWRHIALFALAGAGAGIFLELFNWSVVQKAWSWDNLRPTGWGLLIATISITFDKIYTLRLNHDRSPELLGELPDIVLQSFRWWPHVCFTAVSLIVLFQLAFLAGAGFWLKIVTAGDIPVSYALFIMGGVSYLWTRRNPLLFGSF